LDGLTVEDLATLNNDGQLSMSHVAARAELRTLIQALGLPDTLAAWNTSLTEPISRSQPSTVMHAAP
jgi:hypothetical protein